MKSVLIIIVSLCSVAVFGVDTFRCDYTYYKDADGWLKLHRVPANWHEARLRCYLEGANLASPLNTELRDVIKTIISSAPGDITTGVFTGIHATFSPGDFFSIEGVPLNKIPHTWSVFEPDNIKDKESCIAQLPDTTIADVDCHDPLPYICYIKDTKQPFIPACGTTDKEYAYDSRTGSCYKFHTVPRTWSRAYMACAAEGGHLAIINSNIEAQVIKELFAKHPSSSLVGNFWKHTASIGYHDWGEHGEWLTIHGETLQQAGYEKFSRGEPNNSTRGQYCGAVYRSGLLDDLWCDKVYTFICEKSPDTLLCSDNAV